jgi:SOS response regulatory protein OraA/RecX
VDSDVRRAYIDALKMLGQRELSEEQVRDRLVRREHKPEAIDAAIERLREERSIDDVRVAEAIARSQTSLRGRGKLRVRLQIERAGIAPATARRVVDDVFADLDADALLDAALAKRLRPGHDIADDRAFNRLYRYLVGQGFEPDRVLALLRTRRLK